MLLNVRVGQQNRREIPMGHVRSGFDGARSPYIWILQARYLITTVIIMHVCFAAYRHINACQACPERNADIHMFAWCCIVRNVSILCDRQPIGTGTKDNTI